jgi:hypothetical protein
MDGKGIYQCVKEDFGFPQKDVEVSLLAKEESTFAYMPNGKRLITRSQLIDSKVNAATLSSAYHTAREKFGWINGTGVVNHRETTGAIGTTTGGKVTKSGASWEYTPGAVKFTADNLDAVYTVKTATWTANALGLAMFSKKLAELASMFLANDHAAIMRSLSVMPELSAGVKVAKGYVYGSYQSDWAELPEATKDIIAKMAIAADYVNIGRLSAELATGKNPITARPGSKLSELIAALPAETVKETTPPPP